MKQNRITRTVTFSKEGIDEMKRQAEAERLPVSRYLERLVWAKKEEADAQQ